MQRIILYIVLVSLLFVQAPASAQKSIENQISDSLTRIANSFAAVGKVSVSSVVANQREKRLVVTASDRLSEIPFRPGNVKRIYDMIKKVSARKYPDFAISCITDKLPIEELIPNLYRTTAYDNTRNFALKSAKIPLVTNLSQPYSISSGLSGRHIAIWSSHGWYFNQGVSTWLWQRPRLFQTVEDLYTQAYVMSFLVPMLENAGANVLIPKERDTQPNENVVDNDNSIFTDGRYREHNYRKNWRTAEPGFANSQKKYEQGENPFNMGTYKYVNTITNPNETSIIEWIPELPEEGSYAVYVSYKSLNKSTSDARYTVYHKGGKTEFSVNQTMNGGTWLYLGHFRFPKGRSTHFKIELSNLSSSPDKIVTADAVKVGGGMGNIARKPYFNAQALTNADSVAKLAADTIKARTSLYPRFTEGARYWLQWAGIPDSIYSRTKGMNDYSDDFQSRGFWLNYLIGGSSLAPKRQGLGIPVDLALAFHTDAGTTKNDSIIGTLGICSVTNSSGKTFFENGVSRMASRDLTDIIQTQIVSDVQRLHAPEWTRRGLWNKSYSESRVPEVPTMLLELLSHQNFADMRYGLDPRFRFTVSRAIYKAMLKYIAFNSGQKYVVQPLAVEQFSSRFVSRNKVELSWEAVTDSLEPTATPNQYIIYTRIDNADFDKGIISKNNKVVIEVQSGKIYSFKVAAVNNGGISFPSEVLSVYRAANNSHEVLIVNGFDRVSGPGSFTLNHTSAGFNNDDDAGVPYMQDISFTGKQYEFSRSKAWQSDENPGFGGSFGNYDNKVIAGNTFDYCFLHGNSIKQADFSFVSTSLKAVLNSKIKLTDFRYIDIILGKQKQTYLGNSKKKAEFKTFPLALQKSLNQYCQSGGNLMISGAYIASDFYQDAYVNTDEKLFMESVLKFRFKMAKASFSSKVKMVNSPFPQFNRAEFSLFNVPNKYNYYLESTDAIEPAGVGAVTVSRYTGTNQSAGIVYSGKYKICAFGFPFETIQSEKERNRLMESVLTFFQQLQKM